MLYLQSFRLVQGRLLLGKTLKKLVKLLPFGASCNLIAKMHYISKFWSNKFMDANFFYYFIYDRFIQRQPCACISKFFFKTSPQKLLTRFLPNFTGMFLRKRLKTSLHHYRKSRPVVRYRRSNTYFLFPQCFLSFWITPTPFSSNLKLLFASSFSFERSKFVVCKRVNPLPNNKILDRSELKQTADDILKCI